MKLKQYMNENVAHEAMRKWRKDLLKNGFLQNDAVLDDLGQGTFRINFINHNVEPKWFIKKYLKGVKNVKPVNNMIFIEVK